MFVDSREVALKAFQMVEFDPDHPRKSLNDLRQRAADRYTEVFTYYDRAANNRRWVAFGIRLLAVILLGLGILLLDLAAFDANSDAAKSMANWVLAFIPGTSPGENVVPAGVATLLLAVAAIILAFDRYMLIHRNFVAYRVTEYKLRSMQADFLANFDEACAIGKDSDQATVFVQLKAMASRSYAAAAEEIEEETKAWGESLEQAMESLRSRVESTRTTARKVADDAAKQANAAVENAKFGRLKVIVADAHAGDVVYAIKVEGRDRVQDDKAKRGQFRSFLVAPGNAKVILVDEQGTVINSDFVEVIANDDKTVPL